MNVFVEEKTLNDSDFDENNEFPLIKSKLKVWVFENSEKLF